MNKSDHLGRLAKKGSATATLCPWRAHPPQERVARNSEAFFPSLTTPTL